MKYISLILLLACNFSFAQSFTTKVSPKIIGKEDVLQVEYIAEDVSMDQFTMPRFVNWTVVSGPNLSSSKVIVGSTIKQQTSYSVLLQPQRVGVIIIPGATAIINNKPTRSNQVSVQVKNVSHIQGATPPGLSTQNQLFEVPPAKEQLPSNQYLRKGETAIEKIKDNLLVKVDVSKRSSFVGEPVIVTYKLCTRLRSKSRVVKQPSFTGATVVELTSNYQEPHLENINGKDYRVYEIRKVQLIPIAAGPLSLPPTSVENTVSFYKSSSIDYRDLYYGGPAPVEEHIVTLQSKLLVLDVKQMPPFPSVGNAGFSGAIGRFNVAISSGKEAYTTNNTNHLLFTVTGEGNLQSVRAPQVSWPKGIESFEATEQEETDKDQVPIRVRKTFTIPFVADKAGSYVIPQITFNYFDPYSAKYITKTTPSYLIKVSQVNRALFSKGNAPIDGDFNQRLYIILGAGLLAIIIGLAWYSGAKKASKQKVEEPVVVKPQQVEISPEPAALEYLFQIRELQPADNNSVFYRQLSKCLTAYLFQKFKIQPAQLDSFVQTHPQHIVSLTQFKTLLDNCTLGMYTPVFTMEEALRHRLEAIEIVERLEKEVY